jgi:hypothetical protein
MTNYDNNQGRLNLDKKYHYRFTNYRYDDNEMDNRDDFIFGTIVNNSIKKGNYVNSLYRLDRSAYNSVLKFFENFPQKILEEMKEHHLPKSFLNNLDNYFQLEFQEPAHTKSKHLADHNRGVIDLSIINRWIAEELFENY